MRSAEEEEGWEEERRGVVSKTEEDVASCTEDRSS